jgi:alpha-galactosidase
MYRGLESKGQTGNRLAKPPPEEPDALVAHVRVCEGPGRQRPCLLGNDLKIALIGAGSGFAISVARELAAPVFDGCRFVLMDINPEHLKRAEADVRRTLAEGGAKVRLETTTRQARALDGARYVITSCEINRYPFWMKDLKIPERHGVYQFMAENGGPGGQIHALRNIALFQQITAAMAKYCPQAWLMNFTNPMSFLCTYLNRYTKIRALGFCHQVHGTFGVIAEQLGMEPGELEVITGGVNHFNWLMDIRRRGTGQSYMTEFLARVRKSKYWRRSCFLLTPSEIPRQQFTLEVLNTFGAYPVGYDNHIVEYLPFFYERHEWKKYRHESFEKSLRQILRQRKTEVKAMTLMGESRRKPPFPRDDRHPYYAEKPCQVIDALETNTPTYFDAINIVNHGSISNLPFDAVVDIPALAIGGAVRGIRVGELPIAAMELCRRQITLHEMIARSAHEGDANLFLQALCLDPYVHSITQARGIWKDYLREYRAYLPMFK